MGWGVEKVNGKSSIRFGNTGSFFKGSGKMASFSLWLSRGSPEVRRSCIVVTVVSESTRSLQKLK